MTQQARAADGRTRRRAGQFRRTRNVAVGVAVAAAATWWATGAVGPAPAGAGVPPGRGGAQAFTAAVVPKAGSLSLGVTLGEALAGHINQVAKAQSQNIDLGAIGASATGYNCGSAPAVQPSQLPQPLIVETGDKGAAQGITMHGDGGGLNAVDQQAFSRYGLANGVPYAKARATTMPFGIAGVADVGGGVSTTWSGLVSGDREAGATTDVAALTLPGGVSLSGLHWEAVDQSTGRARRTGVFTIGHATIAGVPIPTSDPSQTLTRLNAVLVPLGLKLTPPVSHVTQGIEYVDPLAISVVPSPTRDGLLNTVLSGIQPIRQQVFQAVLNAVCQSDTAITVADVSIGAISGAGSFTLSLGGVQATSGVVAANGYDLSGMDLIAGGPAQLGSSGPSPVAGGDLGPPGLPSGGEGPGAAGTDGATASAPSPVSAALRPASAVQGERGGALLGVGLGGLALLASVAEADRRKMRRSQRTVVFEE